VEGEPNGTVAWRLNALERRVDRLYDLEPSVVARQVSDLHEDISDLRAEMKGSVKALQAETQAGLADVKGELQSNRRASLGMMASLAIVAVSFALTVLQATGNGL
jgi:hypothetical protein